MLCLRLLCLCFLVCMRGALRWADPPSKESYLLNIVLRNLKSMQSSKMGCISINNDNSKLTIIIIVEYHCYQLHTKFYRVSSSTKLLGMISVGFDVTDQLLIRFSALVRYWRKNGSTMRQYISYS
jgi:hypothetical protein